MPLTTQVNGQGCTPRTRSKHRTTHKHCLPNTHTLISVGPMAHPPRSRSGRKPDRQGSFVGITLKLGIVVTRLRRLDTTWTTVQLAVAALQGGHSVRFIERDCFEIDANHTLLGRAVAFDDPISAQTLVASLGQQTARRVYVPLPQLDVLLLRTAPLSDAVLSMAMMAMRAGVTVINDPAGMVLVSHKAWLASLSGVRSPPTLVTQNHTQADVFYRQLDQTVVVKPARGTGGQGVSLVPRRDRTAFDLAFRRARRMGDGYLLVQPYVQAPDGGEKRLVWCDGRIIGGYQRQPAKGEFRHNLKQGGYAMACAITHADRAIASQVSPHLQQAGIRLAGLDVIGPYLIEVNAVNPGGAFHADRLTGTQVAQHIVRALVAPQSCSRSTKVCS